MAPGAIVAGVVVGVDRKFIGLSFCGNDIRISISMGPMLVDSV